MEKKNPKKIQKTKTSLKLIFKAMEKIEKTRVVTTWGIMFQIGNTQVSFFLGLKLPCYKLMKEFHLTINGTAHM